MPSLVISVLHMPIIMLQFIITMPFINTQQLIIPPDIMAHRFCIIEQAVASEQEHIIFMPPAHFSMCIVHLGTIIMFIVAVAGIMGEFIPAPLIPIMLGSIIIVFILGVLHPEDLAYSPMGSMQV